MVGYTDAVNDHDRARRLTIVREQMNKRRQSERVVKKKVNKKQKEGKK